MGIEDQKKMEQEKWKSKVEIRKSESRKLGQNQLILAVRKARGSTAERGTKYEEAGKKEKKEKPGLG